MRLTVDFYYGPTDEEFLYVAEGNVDIRTVPYSHDADGRRGTTIEEADIEDVSVALDGELLNRSQDTEPIFEQAEEMLLLEAERRFYNREPDSGI